ncbi:hypothetical protein N7471_007055, partial [Penicillium samsonianum]|uniref:uncharacterized protein n=1 Tax=Penicillium samsonianum TaxID=1882272 RepID=UPI0025468044
SHLESLTALQIAFAIFTKVFYNVYLHPLAQFPGPKFYAASPIPVALAQLRGDFHHFTQAAHRRYGAVVRISPNELSFISATAWSDIYARSQGKPPLPRDKTFFNDMLVDEKTLTMADDQNHARMRRAMNPAFAPRALAMQEPILQKNVELFLNQLQSRSLEGMPIDLRLWYNFITFDLIGDLAFGESFGCLATSTYHEWVSFVLDHFYMSTLLQVIHRFRPLNRLFAAIIPSSLAENRKTHEEMALGKVRRRIQRGTERPDFMHPLIEAQKKGTISAEELEQQASILILAGSETTAVALTSATYLLLQSPEVLTELNKELHANFRDESEIDVLSLNRLRYLQAIIEETLRLFPPITNGFPRQTMAGATVIDGYSVPDGTVVNISHWSAYRSEVNFSTPDEFIPDRWLGNSRFDGDAKDVFQPFSVGPRSCIGKKFAYDSIKLVLARTLWRFQMKLDPSSQRSYLADPVSFVSFHQPPLLVNLTARDN